MILIPRFPGTNCDTETYYWAADNIDVEVSYLDSEQEAPDAITAIIIPGGFSHGDYLRAGAIAARSKQMQVVKTAATKNIPILGICNGFQILCESKLLPGVLVSNESKKHHHFMVELSLEDTQTVWLPKMSDAARKYYSSFELPMSCGMGKFIKQGNFKPLMRYINNENRSEDSIASVCSENGLVVGMMPHPERASNELLGSSVGLIFLAGLVENKSLPVKKHSELEKFIQKLRDAK